SGDAVRATRPAVYADAQAPDAARVATTFALRLPGRPCRDTGPDAPSRVDRGDAGPSPPQRPASRDGGGAPLAAAAARPAASGPIPASRPAPGATAPRTRKYRSRDRSSPPQARVYQGSEAAGPRAAHRKTGWFAYRARIPAPPRRGGLR